MTAVWMMSIIINSELKALRRREQRIAQKDLFPDRGRADAMYWLFFFLSAINIEITSFVICLEICLIFLRVIFRFHGDGMKIYRLNLFFAPSSGSEWVVQVIAANVRNQNDVINPTLNLAMGCYFPISRQWSISINHENSFHHSELNVKIVYLSKNAF